MNEEALSLDGVHKRFGDTWATDNVSLSVSKGETLALLGSSGSGKTTLLRIMAGLERVDSGAVRINNQLVDDGRSVCKGPAARGLGMVFQDYALWPHLSALDNVGLALRERGDKLWRRHAEKALEEVGLGEASGRFPHALSGGEQQRVALARSLALKPQLLLFDEPLSNVDAVVRAELRDAIGILIKESGCTAIYVTHDCSEAFLLADRVAIIDSGRICQLDSPQRCYDDPASVFVAKLTGAMGPFDAIVHEGEILFDGERFAHARNDLDDGHYQVLFRSEGLAMVAVGDENAVTGRVRYCGYLGGAWRVDISSGASVFQLINDRPREIGEVVRVQIDWNRALLYPRKETTAVPGG